MGLHTIDIVRRDAAELGIAFRTERVEGGKVRITMTAEGVEMVYAIDLERDVVDEIAFSAGGVSVGRLEFSYLQDIEGLEGKFIAPVGGGQAAQQQDPGLLWLIRLASGSLAK